MIQYVSSYRLTRPGEKEAFGPRFLGFSDTRANAPGIVIGCIKQSEETGAFLYHSYAKATLCALSESNLQTLKDRVRYHNACQARESLQSQKKAQAKTPRGD